MRKIMTALILLFPNVVFGQDISPEQAYRKAIEIATAFPKDIEELATIAKTGPDFAWRAEPLWPPHGVVPQYPFDDPWYGETEKSRDMTTLKKGTPNAKISCTRIGSKSREKLNDYASKLELQGKEVVSRNFFCSLGEIELYVPANASAMQACQYIVTIGTESNVPDLIRAALRKDYADIPNDWYAPGAIQSLQTKGVVNFGKAEVSHLDVSLIPPGQDRLGWTAIFSFVSYIPAPNS
ncbi:hypothetical protein [Cypionkella sp.]|uniref:hypothetical protein n=1 Tax=Cypionkella sp. TaxID=2811411 RepID=UPI00261B7B41|nr:hypothetical protein [Cypionkella sp.]